MWIGHTFLTLGFRHRAELPPPPPPPGGEATEGPTLRDEDATFVGSVGPLRARSHCRVAPPLLHFIQDSLTYSVPLLLKHQCDRTPGPLRAAATHSLEAYRQTVLAELFEYWKEADDLSGPVAHVASTFSAVKRVSVARLYGRVGRLAAENGGSWPGRAASGSATGTAPPSPPVRSRRLSTRSSASRGSAVGDTVISAKHDSNDSKICV
jgi:hypothetical protein